MFSTMMGYLSGPLIRSATIRAHASKPVPGDCGTIIVIGRVG
jgi:hypothetical protein